MSEIALVVMPAGVILLWAGVAASVPSGWAICDGRSWQRVDGAGLIVTPDLRGRVPVGVSADHPLGSTFGAERVAALAAGGHTHNGAVDVATTSTGASLTTTTRSVDAGGSANNVLTSATLNDPQHEHAATLTVEPAGEHVHQVDVIQPSIALHFIMKL